MNVFELFAKIGLDSQEYENGLSKAASMGKSVMGGIGNVAKVGFGVVTAAIGAGTAAMGAFGKSALDSYANYEQLAGGVEKLYGTAADKLMKYAQDGYKTAGMSANQYMETATSFSAALIKSLNGDVDKAAKMTDKAMQAMSDNVNVFGSDMGSVQNAFQGFAKQNYTMLDNLKLGYGGTKEEMQKLIADANEYRASIGETSDLTIDSFADIVTAIDSIQQKQKIAGATAKEAMTTIEGSANMTKAAWENLITAIGRGEGITEAFSGLKDAIFGIGLTEDGKETGLLNQIVPRIQTVMKGAGDAIVEAAPTISEAIPNLVDAVLPSMLEGGISLAGAIGQGIISAVPSLWTSVSSAASTVGGYLYDGMEKAAQATENVDFATPLNTALDKIDSVINGEKVQTFIDNGVKVVTNIAEGIGQGAPTVIPKAADVVIKFVQGIEDNIPQILDAGFSMAEGLAIGLAKALPKLWLEFMTLKFKILAYVAEHVAAFLAKAKDGVANVIQAVGTALSQLPEKIAYWAGYAVTKFGIEILKMPEKWEKAKQALMDKLQDWKENFPKYAEEAASKFSEKLLEGLADLAKKAWDKACEIGKSIMDGIQSFISKGIDLGNLFRSGGEQALNEEKTKSVNTSLAIRDINTLSDDVFDENSEKGFNYEALGEAIVKAFTDADIKMECDNREFGRLVRKAVYA
jgi:phage-related protein